tara:strand:+ start:326 stop:1288 length:963 start_codon:yes stop_codon:yes gene_type:complete
MQPTAASGVRCGEDGDQSTDEYSPSTKRLREVLLGETSAKRPSISGECVFDPHSSEELQDVQSTSTDEERLSPIEGREAKCSPGKLAHYQSWMDTSWRASEGQKPDAAAAASQDAGLQAGAAREIFGGEEDDDPDEGEGEWEGEWGGAWEGCDDVYAGSLGVTGERGGVESSEEEEAEEVDEVGQVKVAGVASAAAAGLLRATARAARMAVALPSVSRAALDTLDEGPRLHITRLLQLHKLTQAAGSGFTREELHKLLSCLPSFEEGGDGGGEGGGDGDGGDGGGGDGGDSEQEVDSEMTLLLAREHARASRMRNARRES